MHLTQKERIKTFGVKLALRVKKSLQSVSNICIKYWFFCRCEPTSASDYVEFSGFMEIRDRKYEKHCGYFKNGFKVESDKKFLRVFFRSNDRLDGAGFNATYHFLDRVEVGRPSPTTNGVKAFSKSLGSS